MSLLTKNDAPGGYRVYGIYMYTIYTNIFWALLPLPAGENVGSMGIIRWEFLDHAINF